MQRAPISGPTYSRQVDPDALVLVLHDPAVDQHGVDVTALRLHRDGRFEAERGKSKPPAEVSWTPRPAALSR